MKSSEKFIVQVNTEQSKFFGKFVRCFFAPHNVISLCNREDAKRFSSRESAERWMVSHAKRAAGKLSRNEWEMLSVSE